MYFLILKKLYDRYTSMQRRFELGTKKQKKRMLNWKSASGINFERLQKVISLENGKTMDRIKSDSYIRSKIEHITITQTFYSRMNLKKRNFLLYKRKKKAEFNFILRFWKVYGNDYAVFIGNWSEVSIYNY